MSAIILLFLHKLYILFNRDDRDTERVIGSVTTRRTTSKESIEIFLLFSLYGYIGTGQEIRGTRMSLRDRDMDEHIERKRERECVC